jgi:type IX secretion system PorP/SprF family membrane protein
MDKRLLLLIYLFLPFKLLAQQLPQYTQYTFNELLINPAVAGVESYWDVKTGYRSQWAGLQGSPTTTYATLSIPFSKEFTLNDYSQMLSNADNPVGRDGARNYRAPQSHGGVSLSIVGDKAGAFSQTHINVGYAYHIQISDGFSLSTGASVGVNSVSLNTNDLTFGNTLDPAVSGGNKQMQPEAALGLWAYGASFFAGASGQQLLPQNLNFGGGGQSQLRAQYFFTIGFKVYPSDDITLLPSTVINISNIGPANIDGNLKIAFRDVFWVGGSYRKNDAVAASLGINIGSYMTIGYAFDHSISDFNSVNKGTHEIMIALFLNNNYNTTSPRHTW